MQLSEEYINKITKANFLAAGISADNVWLPVNSMLRESLLEVYVLFNKNVIVE